MCNVRFYAAGKSHFMSYTVANSGGTASRRLEQSTASMLDDIFAARDGTAALPVIEVSTSTPTLPAYVKPAAPGGQGRASLTASQQLDWLHHSPAPPKRPQRRK